MSGFIKNLNAISLSATLSFISMLGFQRTAALLRQPWISMDVINPIGLLNKNAAAKTYTKNDTNAFLFFDHANEIKIEHQLYKPLNFTPHAVQHMNGFKFIYLQPE